MGHFGVDEIKKLLAQTSDEKLNEILTKGVLRLSDNEIDTLMFVFCLCYKAELDIEAVLTVPWSKLAQKFSAETITRAKEILNVFLLREKESEPTLDDALRGVDLEKANEIRKVVTAKYRIKNSIQIDRLDTFGEKIRAYSTMFSSNNVADILGILKDLRDDLSHGRIKKLKYNGVLLNERSAKEQILSDYLTAVSNPDHGKSRLIDELKLLPEESEEIKRIFASLV